MNNRGNFFGLAQVAQGILEVMYASCSASTFASREVSIRAAETQLTRIRTAQVGQRMWRDDARGAEGASDGIDRADVG